MNLAETVAALADAEHDQTQWYVRMVELETDLGRIVPDLTDQVEMAEALFRRYRQASAAWRAAVAEVERLAGEMDRAIR